MEAFLADYPNAWNRANQLDQKISANASAISSDYQNLVALAARQVFGATELTGGNSPSDVMMFMKDVGTSRFVLSDSLQGCISSNQHYRRMNPVDVLYASFPFFLYLNATYAGHLLTPLLEYQDSPQWTQPYAARDLGRLYIIPGLLCYVLTVVKGRVILRQPKMIVPMRKG